MKYAPLKTSLCIAKGGTFFFLKDKNTILAVHLFSVGWYCRMFCSVSAGCCKVFEKQLHCHPDVSVSMSNRAESFNSPCLEVRPFTLSLLSVPVNTVLKTDRAAFAHRRCVNHGWTSVSKAFSDGLSVFSGYDTLCWPLRGSLSFLSKITCDFCWSLFWAKVVFYYMCMSAS